MLNNVLVRIKPFLSFESPLLIHLGISLQAPTRQLSLTKREPSATIFRQRGCFHSCVFISECTLFSSSRSRDVCSLFFHSFLQPQIILLSKLSLKLYMRAAALQGLYWSILLSNKEKPRDYQLPSPGNINLKVLHGYFWFLLLVTGDPTRKEWR